MQIRYSTLCFCLLVIGCVDTSKNGHASGSDASENTKRVYRCKYSPLLDPGANGLFESLQNQKWRVAADRVCNDPDIYDGLGKIIASLSDYTNQDYPFVGYCEHFLLTDGSAKGVLIGFVCEDYGIVVWETELDEQGRWQKTASNKKRGTEADKAAIQEILSKARFQPL